MIAEWFFLVIRIGRRGRSVAVKRDRYRLDSVVDIAWSAGANMLRQFVAALSFRSLSVKFSPVLFICVAVLCDVAFGQPFFADGQKDPKPTGKTWTPVQNMSDEFDGNELDQTKWFGDPSVKEWGWLGRPPGLFKESSIAVEDGHMNVTVGVLDKPEIINGDEFRYHGAIIRSKHPGRVGDYFECRMKANHTEMSSTFWLITGEEVRPRLELDIQECVGKTSELTEKWGRHWNQIFHVNAIVHFNDGRKRIQIQKGLKLETENWQRFYVYGAWWKSPHEIQFFLDGQYRFSLKPEHDWDVPAYLQMAIETYDWNPVPEDGGLIASAPLEQRKTRYDWVRTWRLK